MLRMRRQGNWRSVHVSQRGTIKQALLTALASKSEGARTSAAQAIAKAGGIDVPAGEWPDLIQLLLGAAMNASLDSGVKAATLKCLGYLLEELPGDAVDVPTVNQVLTAIVDAMAPGRAKELVRAATVAMLAALDFAGESFSEERVAERNALMSSICSATQSDDVETRSGGFDCIIRVAELYYDSLGMYMNTLAQLTFAAARNAGDEATAVRAVEFWTTIAETEEELGPEDSGNNKYIVTALKALVEMLTGLMLTVGEDDGEDVYGPSQAAASCLGAVAKVAQDAVLDHVMPFVNSSFGSASWQAREAATLAMGVVMEGPDPAVVGGLINKALPAMLDRLTPGAPGRDPSVPVRDTTAWTIGHAFECLFDHLDMTSLFARTVTTLDAALDDEARVAQNAAYALHNIAAQCGYHVNEAGETPLTPHLMRLIGHLMARCDKDDWDESNLRTVCFETINMMVENVGEADHRVLGALLEEGARRLAASLGKPMMTADDKEEQGGLQVLLTAMLQTIAVELAEGVKPAADVLVGLLLRVFEGRLSAAAEEAYRALGAVASGCGADFAKYMPTVFPRLLEGIANTAEAQVCNAAIWAAAESCRALDAAVAPYAVPLVESLLAVLQSMEVHRSVKPPAIGALGDLALAVGPALEPHLGPIAQLLDQAARTPLPADADEDLAEYVGQLRLAVLEAWVGIFQGYNNEAAKPKGEWLWLWDEWECAAGKWVETGDDDAGSASTGLPRCTLNAHDCGIVRSRWGSIAALSHH